MTGTQNPCLDVEPLRVRVRNEYRQIAYANTTKAFARTLLPADRQ